MMLQKWLLSTLTNARRRDQLNIVLVQRLHGRIQFSGVKMQASEVVCSLT